MWSLQSCNIFWKGLYLNNFSASHHRILTRSSQLPPKFKTFLAKHVGGRGPKSSLFAHCWHELFHAQLYVLIDDEFVEEYLHGIVIMCHDGIARHFYPCLFTYLVDYPEKWAPNFIHITLTQSIITRVLIATIKNKGKCPCPQCLIPKGKFHNLGSYQDQCQHLTLARVDDDSRWSKVDGARRLMYEKHYALDGKAVDALLQGQSLVPTKVNHLVCL